jgi:hypothetical protein
MRRKGLMRADYGYVSWVSVENQYTPSRRKSITEVEKQSWRRLMQKKA